MPITKSPAWLELSALSEKLSSLHLRDLFASDPDRFSRLSVDLDGLLVDFSKQRVDAQTLDMLLTLARDSNLADWREKMFAGEKINVSENRAGLHPALRHLALSPFPSVAEDVMPEVRVVRAQMRQFSERVRAGLWRGFSGEAIRDVVDIGIGGSDLGPKMVVRALGAFQRPYLLSSCEATMGPAHSSQFWLYYRIVRYIYILSICNDGISYILIWVYNQLLRYG